VSEKGRKIDGRFLSSFSFRMGAETLNGKRKKETKEIFDDG
jgi:hypothetical protein